jgi:hypothetical protein
MNRLTGLSSGSLRLGSYAVVLAEDEVSYNASPNEQNSNETNPRVILVSLTAFCFASGQSPKRSGTQSGEVEEILRGIEQEIVNSLLKRDPSANQRYLSDDVILTTPEGVVNDKKQTIADVISSDLKLLSSRISDMKVRLYGDTAILTYRTTDSGTYRGNKIDGQHRWTETFVRRNGNWQIVASHGSRVAAP